MARSRCERREDFNIKHTVNVARERGHWPELKGTYCEERHVPLKKLKSSLYGWEKTDRTLNKRSIGSDLH